MVTFADVKGMLPSDAADLLLARYPTSAEQVAEAKARGAHTVQQKKYWAEVVIRMGIARRLEARGPCHCKRCR